MSTRAINKATYKFHSRLMRTMPTKNISSFGSVNSGIWFESKFINRQLCEEMYELMFCQRDLLSSLSRCSRENYFHHTKITEAA